MEHSYNCCPPLPLSPSPSPQVSNLEQLASWGLTLSDLSRHDGRRSLVLMGEHLQSEIEMARRLDRLSKALDKERKLNEQLINRMLPPKVATELRARRPVPPESFDGVTIFFSDIENFTPLTAQCKPIEIVHLLNQLYQVMDFCVSLVPSLYKVGVTERSILTFLFSALFFFL